MLYDLRPPFFFVSFKTGLVDEFDLHNDVQLAALPADPLSVSRETCCHRQKRHILSNESELTSSKVLHLS